MAIFQTICTSFRAELLLGVHDFRPSAQSGADVFKLALYTSMAGLDANTTTYTSTGEVSAYNYAPGGAALTNLGVSATQLSYDSGVGFCSFATLTFTDVTITARGALIYNSTPSALSNTGAVLPNAAVCVLDFGADKRAVEGQFVITFPVANASSAIIRVT
jgi:hypothetical protein